MGSRFLPSCQNLGLSFLFFLLFPLLSIAQINQISTTYIASTQFNLTGDNFGYAMATSGNLMVVGAWKEDATSSSSNNQGAAYLFDCTSLPCSQIARLTASDGSSGDQFGNSVAISGSTVVVGAAADAVGSLSSAGSAYVFSCNSTSCTQIARLTAFDAASSDAFGYSVATNGNLVAVGSRYADISGVSDRGAVYVYDCSTGTCSLVVKLNGTGGLYSNFASSISMDGSKLLVGSSEAKIGANSSQGAIFLYDCTSSSCTLLVSNLTASDGAASTYFGISVAISGDMVVVGARAANSNKGAAYIFQCISSCTQKAILVAPDGADSDYFGFSVATRNQVVAVGAYRRAFNTSITYTGAAYVFDCLNFNCAYLAKLVASDPASNDYLGYSVGILGSKVAAGAYQDAVLRTTQGSVKIFDVAAAICCNLAGTSSATTCDAPSRVGDCTCKPGWIDTKCNNDLDECAMGTHNCDGNATCTNTAGSFTCTCNPGYWGSGSSCAVDLCVPGFIDCDPNASCTNIPGSYSCTCKAGYSGNGTYCQDKDECTLGTSNCNANANCTNTIGSFTCACKTGYSGNGTSCTDVNECTLGTHNCAVNATCSNTGGSFTCTCKTGFTGNGTYCADKDECTLGTSNCHANATCTNTVGSFTCACKTGFTGSGTSCSDVNECTLGTHNCDSNAICNNTIGSFTCTCKPGFSGNGTFCSDNDECTLGTHNCDAHATCSNTFGSFSCACNVGYSGSGTSCSDNNECTLGTHNCDSNATCTNTFGSFTCTCDSGYSGNGISCSDDDECALETDNCHAEATCTNTFGSFTCACNAGYSGDGISSCSDVDECTLGTHNCDALATCSNTLGSFTCVCAEGYSGSGTACSDNDECTLGTHNCDAHATCSNTFGSFTCSCNLGYSGDGISCSDDDECALETDNCNAEATCTNTLGSFSCACNDGYSGDGISCSDVDECTLGTHNCDSNAICTNTIGSFSCACADGFIGDGFNCEASIPCNGNGERLDGGCACYSGFSGEDCSVDSSSTCSPLPTVPLMETQEIAELMGSQSSVSSNTFSFVIHSPGTRQRYFSSISLNKIPGCSYPFSSSSSSGHFSKTFLGAPTCKDAFTGRFSIPELIQDCGFLQASEPGFTVLSGRIHVTSKDQIGTVMSHSIMRTTSSALAVNLRLPTFINLTTSDLAVTSSISALTVVTRQEYDLQADTAVIEITSSLHWPYQLVLAALAQGPNDAFSYLAQVVEVECSQDAFGSQCLQVITLTISNITGSSACSFSGQYVLDWTYDCRTGGSGCPLSGPEIFSANFTLTSEDICAQLEIDTSLTGDLRSYSDGTFAAERIVVAANERMFFKISLASDVTIQSISISELRVVQSQETKIIGQNDEEVEPFLTSLDFHWNETSDLSSNERGFSFLAKTGSSSSDLFASSSSGSNGITSFAVEIDLEITYRTTFGRKRDLGSTSLSLSTLMVLDASRI